MIVAKRPDVPWAVGYPVQDFIVGWDQTSPSLPSAMGPPVTALMAVRSAHGPEAGGPWRCLPRNLNIVNVFMSGQVLVAARFTVLCSDEGGSSVKVTVSLSTEAKIRNRHAGGENWFALEKSVNTNRIDVNPGR